MENDREEKVKNVLERNVENVVERAHLRQALLGGGKLRIKHGIDPTGDKIHIGQAVVLWKLKEFQDLGHKVVLIIGDFTAQIGDPSDKLSKRPFLSKTDIKKNLKNYLPQIGKILNLKKVEVRYNSEWLSKLDFREVSDLAEVFSVQQMVKRRNFSERWEKEEEISLREFLYPLMQGYDSVAMKADLELGGTDQLFNLMAGRKIQEHYGQRPQDVMITKMLLGTDGRKMSTSWGNVINIIDSPGEQFGKVMSMRDDSIVEYFALATDASVDEVKETELELNKSNPKIVKEKLATRIVRRYHGEEAALKAKADFEKVFSKRDFSVPLPVLGIPRSKFQILELVVTSGVVTSRSEARRLIEQGGVDVDDENISDPRAEVTFKGGEVLRVGKKNFFKVQVVR
ncbi:MAG: tyrosine--tRNA ligase [Patescibacteria group bacterium]